MCVSNLSGEGIDEVREVLRDEAQPYDADEGTGLLHYGQEVPLGWFKFNSITRALAEKGQKRISLVQAQTLAKLKQEAQTDMAQKDLRVAVSVEDMEYQTFVSRYGSG
jgi:hypothetical protein